MHIELNTEVDSLFSPSKDWENKSDCITLILKNQVNSRDKHIIYDLYHIHLISNHTGDSKHRHGTLCIANKGLSGRQLQLAGILLIISGLVFS